MFSARYAWGQQLAARVVPVERPPRPPSDGKLRIGYVSAFFDKANWMKPVYGVINRHDRDRFEVHLVSLGGDPSAAVGYRGHDRDVIWQVGSCSDDEVARLLAAAGIDVLIDLNAYGAPKWLRLFLRRPAPVQLAWFNSFATSGLACFDGIVGDDVVIPPDEEGLYTERVLRVRGTYLAFEVFHPVPDIAPPPCKANQGGLTFGALASAYKLNDLTLDIRARILLSAPTSRLLIRASTLAEPSNRDHLRTRLADRSVAGERVDLEGGAAHFDFLRSYDRIDIALDTFPYNGGTTTTEALWQGVPVLTYVGGRWVARTSASLLRAAGPSTPGSRAMQTIGRPKRARWRVTRLPPPASLPCAPACAPALRHLPPAIRRGCAWRWNRSIGSSQLSPRAQRGALEAAGNVPRYGSSSTRRRFVELLD